jgi:hypothetical protein
MLWFQLRRGKVLNPKAQLGHAIGNRWRQVGMLRCDPSRIDNGVSQRSLWP